MKTKDICRTIFALALAFTGSAAFASYPWTVTNNFIAAHKGVNQTFNLYSTSLPSTKIPNSVGKGLTRVITTEYQTLPANTLIGYYEVISGGKLTICQYKLASGISNTTIIRTTDLVRVNTNPVCPVLH